MAKEKYWELKFIVAIDDAKKKTPLWCTHYPIPCDDCDLKTRCLKEEEPMFTWKELDDAGVNFLSEEQLEDLIQAAEAANIEAKKNPPTTI